MHREKKRQDQGDELGGRKAVLGEVTKERRTEIVLYANVRQKREGDT